MEAHNTQCSAEFQSWCLVRTIPLLSPTWCSWDDNTIRHIIRWRKQNPTAHLRKRAHHPAKQEDVTRLLMNVVGSVSSESNWSGGNNLIDIYLYRWVRVCGEIRSHQRSWCLLTVPNLPLDGKKSDIHLHSRALSRLRPDFARFVLSLLLWYFDHH